MQHQLSSHTACKDKVFSQGDDRLHIFLKPTRLHCFAAAPKKPHNKKKDFIIQRSMQRDWDMYEMLLQWIFYSHLNWPWLVVVLLPCELLGNMLSTINTWMVNRVKKLHVIWGTPQPQWLPSSWLHTGRGGALKGFFQLVKMPTDKGWHIVVTDDSHTTTCVNNNCSYDHCSDACLLYISQDKYPVEILALHR